MVLLLVEPWQNGLALGSYLYVKLGNCQEKLFLRTTLLNTETATIEMHDDAINAGAKILLIDDLIATGGTAAAGIKLIERLGGEVVHAGFIIDLPELGGARVIRDLGVPVTSLCAFEGE